MPVSMVMTGIVAQNSGPQAQVFLHFAIVQVGTRIDQSERLISTFIPRTSKISYQLVI